MMHSMLMEVNRLDVVGVVELVVELVVIFVDSVHTELERLMVLGIVVRVKVHLALLVV